MTGKEIQMNIRVTIRIISLLILIWIISLFILSIIYPLTFDFDFYFNESVTFKIGFVVSLVIFFATKKEKNDSSFDEYVGRISSVNINNYQDNHLTPEKKNNNSSNNKVVNKLLKENSLVSQTSAVSKNEDLKKALMEAPAYVHKGKSDIRFEFNLDRAAITVKESSPIIDTENTNDHFENDLDRAARAVKESSPIVGTENTNDHFENDLDRAARAVNESPSKIRIKDWFKILSKSLFFGFCLTFIMHMFFHGLKSYDFFVPIWIILSFGIHFYEKKQTAIHTTCPSCKKEYAISSTRQITIDEQTIWKQETIYEQGNSYKVNVPYTRKYYWQFLECDFCGYELKYKTSSDTKE